MIAQLLPTKRPHTQMNDTQSDAVHSAVDLNGETLLRCVLAEAPCAELAQRYTQLSSVYREMAAPTMLTHAGHLLSDVAQSTPLRSSIPLVPSFTSQRALMVASARDVSWIDLQWQLSDFYNLGRCETLRLSDEDHTALSEALLRNINGVSGDAYSDAVYEAFSETALAEGDDQGDSHPVMVVRARAPVDTVSLRYQVPGPEAGQPVLEHLQCRVVPLAALTDDHPDAADAFVGLPVVSYELCGPYSEPDPAEAQLYSAHARQAQLRDLS